MTWSGASSASSRPRFNRVVVGVGVGAGTVIIGGGRLVDELGVGLPGVVRLGPSVDRFVVVEGVTVRGHAAP